MIQLLIYYTEHINISQEAYKENSITVNEISTDKVSSVFTNGTSRAGASVVD